MSDEQRHGEEAVGRDGEGDFEEHLRELLAEDAYTIRPSPAPYPAIRRRGLVERRRRVAAAGAVLVTLAAMPVGAYALGGGGWGQTTATAATPSVSATRDTTPTPSPTPSGPGRPASKGQLLDGITFEQAAEGLEKCLAFDRSHSDPAGFDNDLGRADSYRIILAMNSTGDSNAPGDGMYVVAVQGKPAQTRLICRVSDGEAAGLNVSSGNDADTIADEGPVFVDPNNGKLYQQSVIDRGNWKLPFRWGVVGTVRPSVAKVTVSYGDSSAEAALDHGWFVASGVLNEQVTVAPHIKGYDADGKLVYDSDEDKYYQRTLP
ncbi:hypothetical protein J7F01_17060 [Streptomyces sp. ISL-22]|uniref:hypothetical protein n=1 Tax=unclassified Streptomyces TaxID=2593676 RepID=UPI001BE74E1A|nr:MULTISPECIES: hypothetical protein [unclassified Streptomyces]MBT2419986.1 hypothetical protein [Streptomyces sp. ISL-24]MBT2433860.1 hypothetical protein [Streptomyces sp. ISL-22]